MSALVWRDRVDRPAWQQMAIDVAMVAVAAEHDVSLLRLYQWQGDTLSLGANESALRTWNRAALERDGVPCVRRPSGGRGVWHGATDLTYAWVGPSGGPAGVRQRYRELHDRIGRAIATCGTVTTLAAPPGRAAGLAPGACFDTAVGGEVLVSGRKAVGSAQKVFGRQLLQHGAIAIGGSEAGARYRLAGRAAQSSQQDHLPDADRLASVIAEQWLAEGATPAPDTLTEQIVVASVQHEPQFRDPSWTWRR